jgi:pyrroline-5-carboxylate reductase
MRIAFIGGGHMTTSLVGGLRARGAAAGDLHVSDPVPAQLERLRSSFGVDATTDNAAAVRDADLVVLAVKPQDMAAAASGIADELARRRRVVVSIAAGIRLANLAAWLGAAVPLVRTMPNRPALIGAGITAAFAGPSVVAADRAAVEEVLSAAGPLVWLEDESQMDVVTAVSGSGPAYFFLLVEALEDAGTALGLPRATARQLAVHTALGAGRMAAEGGASPTTLREQVTSKGGTTAAALAVLEQAGLRGIFAEAVTAATRRSAELADQFGGTTSQRSNGT